MVRDPYAEVVLDRVLAGPTDVEDQLRRAFEQYRMLEWMASTDPSLTRAVDERDKLVSAYPELAKVPRVDFTSYLTGGWVGPRYPMSPDELHDRIGGDTAAAIEDLERYKNVTYSFDEPSWIDALSLAQETVRANPADGLLLRPHSTDRDLTAAVIQGWTTADVDAGTLDAVLVSLLELDAREYADELSLLLERYGAADGDQLVRLPAARRLAEELWKHAKSDDSYEDPANGWVLEAINHWAGRVAQFWVRAVVADRTLAGEAWAGLPTELRARVDELLSSDGERMAMAQVVLALQAHVLTVVDPKWFKATVLPLLDWANPEQASRTWSGYLAGGRWSEELLDAGLAEQYTEAITHAERFDTETRNLLWDHVASIAVTGLRDPTPWIKQVVVLRPVDDRVMLANKITWTLDRLSPGAADGLWNRWMRAYWDDRLKTVPLPLERGEASAMAAWPTRLTDSLHDAVDRAVKAPAGLDGHGGLLGHLDDAGVTDRAPGDIARLLAHLLKYTSPPFWGGDYLEKLVPRLAASASSTDISEIREQAVRLGYVNAPNW